MSDNERKKIEEKAAALAAELGQELCRRGLAEEITPLEALLATRMLYNAFKRTAIDFISHEVAEGKLGRAFDDLKEEDFKKTA